MNHFTIVNVTLPSDFSKTTHTELIMLSQCFFLMWIYRSSLELNSRNINMHTFLQISHHAFVNSLYSWTRTPDRITRPAAQASVPWPCDLNPSSSLVDSCGLNKADQLINLFHVMTVQWKWKMLFRSHVHTLLKRREERQQFKR